MLKRFSLFFPILLVIQHLISPLALAGQKVDQVLTVLPDGKLFIDVSRGFVKVEGWDKETILIEGEIDDSVKELLVKTKQGKSIIKAVNNDNKHWGDSSVLRVFIPERTKLYFKGVDTTFVIEKLTSGVEGKTITGELKVQEVANSIELSTMSGDIKLLEAKGEARLESVSGSIIVDSTLEKLTLRSMSGDLKINLATVRQLKGKSVSGDVMLVGDLAENAQASLASVNGDIVYWASEQLNAQCTATSQFGGEITNNLTDDVAKKEKFKGQSLSFVSGKGAGQLSLKTISGNVIIEKGEQ